MVSRDGTAICRNGICPDYVGVTLEPLSVGYYESEDSFGLKNVGIHGGMSPDEVRIPLIVL